MGRPRLYAPLLAAAFAAASLHTAFAQVGQGVTYNRPSISAPSSRLGYLGGRYTRQYSVERLTPTGATALLERAEAGVGVPRTHRRKPTTQFSTAPMRLGLIPAPEDRRLLRAGYLSEDRIRISSGFTASVSANVPLYDPRLERTPPLPQTPLYDLTPKQSPFQRFFGLIPVRRERLSHEPVSYETILEEVDQQTLREVRQTEQQAQRLFREATGAPLSSGEVLPQQKRSTYLRRAVRLFSNVTNLDHDAYLPAILTAHAYLERFRASESWQTNAAVQSLITAARIHPEAFHENPNIASYFGDVDPTTGRSELLDRQMRYYIRGSTYAATVGNCVLEAYCGWVLEEDQRALLALDKAADLVQRGQAAHPHVDKLIAALRYALNTRL